VYEAQPPKVTFTTRDLGLAIRDHLEQSTVCHYEEKAGGEVAEVARDEAVFVDATDPNNLIVGLNGQMFQVRIFAIGDANA
jgi:hypothetical protein